MNPAYQIAASTLLAIALVLGIAARVECIASGSLSQDSYPQSRCHSRLHSTF